MSDYGIVKQTTRQEAIAFRNKKLLASSRGRYRNAVNNYYAYLARNGLPDAIESVREWLATISNPSTYNLSLQALKEFLLKRFENESPERRLELRESLESIRRKRAKEAKTNLEYLNKTQIDTLCQLATPTISMFIQAMFWSGCRVSELVNIKLKDCTVGSSVAIRVVGKGNKEREVYIPRKLYNTITGLFKGTVYLFETKEKRPYRREFITHEITRQAKQKMDIKISAHTLRHSKAMFLKEIQGLSADRIAKALGHSSVVTTLKYYFHGTPTAAEQGIE
ncbi:MAG: site-specific integrase [Spirochaetes bacterium]|nr:site-specific integrase [Spirochaetota bacterium]